MRTRTSTRANYVPPISFAEAYARGGMVPLRIDDADAEVFFGPIADSDPADPPAPFDPLEAFCDAWGAAGMSPAIEPYPSR